MHAKGWTMVPIYHSKARVRDHASYRPLRPENGEEIYEIKTEKIDLTPSQKRKILYFHRHAKM